MVTSNRDSFSAISPAVGKASELGFEYEGVTW